MKHIALTAALMAATAAHAAFFDGNGIYNNMQSRNYVDKSHALGYVGGVYDAHVGEYFCPPSGVTLGQAQDVVEKFLRDTPTVRTENAAFIALAALQMAWPCNRGGKSS